MKNYFYVTAFYNDKNYVGKRPIHLSSHLIKAHSKEESIEIAYRHGMAYPRHSKNVMRYRSRKLDLRKRHWKALIERRKQGKGGNSWYEDKNGRLQYETNQTT